MDMFDRIFQIVYGYLGVVACCVGILFLIDYFDLRSVEEEPTVPPSSALCSSIAFVESDQSRVRIRFKRPPAVRHPNSLSACFAFWTSAFDLPLLMPPGSGRNFKLANHSLTFEFMLPFVQTYPGHLLCVDTSLYQKPHFQLPQFPNASVVSQFAINLSVPSFRNDYDGTQMLCHGTRSEDRWCEVRHLGLSHGHFVMETAAHFRFPTYFLCLGGRAPPFASASDIVSNEPIVTDQPLSEVGLTVARRKGLSFICGTGETTMLFRLVFDFILPGFLTKQSLVEFSGSEPAQFLTKESVHPSFMELTTALTGSPPLLLPNSQRLVIYEKAVLGLAKVDANPDGTRSILEAFGHMYHFPDDFGPRVRARVLSHLNISERSSENVTITFFETYDPKHLNIEQLRRIVAQSCRGCQIETVLFPGTLTSDAVRIVSQSSVLIARSGVGVEYAPWLPPGSHILELRPHNCWCHDGFEITAKLSQSEHDILAAAIPEKSGRRECHSAPAYCQSMQCREFLFTQPMNVPLAAFKEKWMTIRSKLDI
jgi:hypothetical protein